MRKVILLILLITVCFGAFGQTTYYSYQSGSWSSNSTWTTDPSGTLWINGTLPGINDNVVILNGRTVKINESGKQINSLWINNGGILDLQSTITHNFGTVSGQGLMRLNAASFPGGSFLSFVSAGGGTIEYYNLTGILPMPTFPANTFNHLLITKSDNVASNYNIVLANDLLINGDLTLSNSQAIGTLTLTIGNNTTARAITINGNMVNKAACSLVVGSFNALHSLTIWGDLTNLGKIDLNNNAANVNNTLGAAKITFKGATNNKVTINSTTSFYDFYLDKGVDQTAMLDISSTSAVAPFEGYAGTMSMSLINGTLKLNTNINVPLVKSGGNYDISVNQDGKAGLWIASNASVVFQNPLVIYGKLHVSDNASLDGGPVIVTRESGEIVIEGGTVVVGQFRPSTVTASTPRGSFTMTGGTFNVRGPQHAAGFAIFDWPYANTSFKMSGGTININDANATGSLQIGSSNYDITGGTININIPTSNTAIIKSTIPLWNLNISKTAGSAQVARVSGLPLTILNNLTLVSGNTPTFDANSQNISVGGNFTIQAGTTYLPGSNTTTFSGSGGQVFDISGSISGGLYNLALSNTSNTTIKQDITVTNNLTIGAGCFLNDNGQVISLNGNVFNSGTHTSQANGGIMMNGAGNQQINGSGAGVFGNFVINKATGASTLFSNQSIQGNLRLANGILDLSTYNLLLGINTSVYDALSGASSVFSGSKMIRTTGNQSDGGVSKVYNSTTAFVFPVGTGSNYTPATIQFNSAPTIWGTVTAKPVSQYNPLVTSTNSLNYYWKIVSSGFSGIQSGSVSHTYRYVNASLVGRGTESNYIPALYRPMAWTYINDISKVVDLSNDILFNNVSYLEGEYTAGEIDAFQSVKVFYSRQSGNWNDYLTWSTDSVGGNAVPDPSPGPNVTGINIPGPNNPVVIGNGNTKNHVVTIPAGFNNVSIGNLMISNGSVLDITTTTGHNFGVIPDTKITGSGKLRISSTASPAVFPGGDFGAFLSAGGGTVEYYTTGTTNFTLPSGAAVSTYNNLQLSPGTGQNITMPAQNIKVFSDFLVSGLGEARLNSANSSSLEVQKNLSVQQGTLRFMNNNNAQTLTILGDVTVSNGATFDVTAASNAVNTMTILGNMVNNGTFDMYGNSGNAACDVTFTGNTNKTISGTATLTEFNYLTLDKGNSRNTLLDATITKLTLSGSGNALKLNNGTFRISNSLLHLILSTSNSFIIPKSGCLSVNLGIVDIGTSFSAGDLLLAGRLEVINNGVVNIGNGGAFDNDIEYAASGVAEIVIKDNATLTVNGQIRRGTTVTSGSLSYTQIGGNVIINGQNQFTQRGKFEISNAGSLFAMSGGTITITNGGGDPNWYGDILLIPEAYAVTGGTIQIGSGTTTSNTFYANLLSPVGSLTIDGTTSNKILNIRVNSVVIQNNLTINGSSEFRANGWDVSIGGNFSNQHTNSAVGLNNGGYQVGTATQNTSFNGGSTQTISGVGSNLTNFANLQIAPSGTVTLNSNSKLQVNGNLIISSGILSDGGNNLVILGNIDNSAIHQSSGLSGGIVLSGTLKQFISGNGSGIFGNITINNAQGINMIDNSVVNGQLTFLAGSLYIDDYLLTLGISATIAGTPDATKMLLLNGALSDQGIKKLYPSGVGNFVFPIGVNGKYSPAQFNITSSGSAGTIQVKPVNSKHPGLQGVAADELGYYWVVKSTGFASPVVNHSYTYKLSDVSGIEGNFVTGRYVSGNWIPNGGIPGTINTTTHVIQLTGVNYIDGEYTAGESTNFGSIPVYYSRVSGNWEDPATWLANGVLATSAPNGNRVFISPGHTVSVNVNSQKAYSVNVPVSAVLNLNSTVFHNLGYLSGGGTLKITSTSDGMFVMPGGDYDSLMMVSTSTVVFTNPNVSIPATLPLKPGNIYKPFQNVIMEGVGAKYMSSDHLKVLGNLTINGGFLSNELYNKNIYALGNWTDNVSSSSAIAFVAGKGLVSFEGTAPQVLTVLNSGGTNYFYNFRVNNSSALTLAGGGNIQIANYLYLANGNINTNSTNSLTLTNVNPDIVSGGSSSSFVNGPLRKIISNGSYFNFPVGKSGRYGNLSLTNILPSGTLEAEYYSTSPGLAGMPVSSRVLPIDTVNNTQYWRVTGPAAVVGNVKIRWDNQDVTNGFIPGTVQGRTKIRIVKWNGSAWQSQGNSIDDANKTVQTNPALSLTGNSYFGLAVESLPTAIITAGAASICNDGSSANIRIDLTGVAPWTIKYKVNGSNETMVSNIASTPYYLVVSNGLSALSSGPGNYTFTLSQVLDATLSLGTKDFSQSYAITLNESPNPSIIGNTTVPGGQSATYIAPNIAGHTYVWTVTGAASFTGQNTNSILVTWGAGPSGTVRLTETVTVGGCAKTTPVFNVNITDIPNPSVSGNSSVCQQTSENYSTPTVGTHTYVWTVTGGTITSGQNTSQITVQWTSSGANTVKVDETGSATRSNTLDVTIYPVPSILNSITSPTICSGETANITLQSAAAGITYQLRLNADNSNVGSSVSSGPGGNVTLPVAPAITTVYKIIAVNEYNCSVQLNNQSTVTVNPTPNTGGIYRKPNQ